MAQDYYPGSARFFKDDVNMSKGSLRCPKISEDKFTKKML